MPYDAAVSPSLCTSVHTSPATVSQSRLGLSFCAVAPLSNRPNANQVLTVIAVNCGLARVISHAHLPPVMSSHSVDEDNNLKKSVVIPCPEEMEVTPFRRERRFYKANDVPTPLVSLLYGFQQVMVCVSALLVIPFVLSEDLCPGQDIHELRVRLISSTFVCSGISTIIQTCLGMRLALLQGAAFAYIPSVEVFMALPENRCNATINDFVPREEYEGRFAMIQGCLMLSALVPMFIGSTGIVGLITKFISPITVSPLMLLLVLSAVDLCVGKIEKHWVAVVQAATLFATILYLAEWKVPVPGFKNGRFRLFRTNVFGQYPYLIAILFSWGFCVVLTVANLVPEGSEARTDKNASMNVIRESPWFRVPYPGQFGAPRFHAGLFFAFIVSALTSVFESVGDYHAAARVSEERAPPSHAINRGILAEGAGSFLSGMIGPGVGMTTHTENIGVIGVTRVASRFTMVIAGFLLIFLGVFTKIGAVLSTIPDPLIGGVLASSMAMVGGVAIANVQAVDLRSSRNVAILGFAIMVGMIIPRYFTRHPIETGVETLDAVLKVLLTLPMFVGAFTACVLDNTVPGVTREQRGLKERGRIHDLGPDNYDVYAFPERLAALIDRIPYASRLPCVPKTKKAPTNKVQDSSQQ
uniref:Sulfate_transp domain-containing protein n=1 Tax=Steinernema glaseri TaxID=37863 RepID=A0A1I7YL57_9BILA